MGRGDEELRKKHFVVTEWLQRGRAFWGAEIRIVGKEAVDASLLQRGRAFWGAEIRYWWGVVTRPRTASTGPRLLGRGDVATDAAQRCLTLASTGPRLLGRGDA